MYRKSLVLWYYMLPFIALSSMLWPSSTSNDRKKSYSTVRNQLGANIRRNDDKEDLIRYNLHESSTIDNDVMQYAHHINFTSNSKNEDLIQYKYQTHVAKKHENDSQTSMQFRINSKKTSGKKNFMSREIHENLKRIKDENDSTSYNFFKNFDRYNIVPDKICDNITCIRLCCPFGNRLVNGKCIAQQGEFIFLQNMYGYINNSLQNESKRVDELFLLIVDDPCQKTGHYLLDSYQNTFLVNGSLYLPYYNTIVESTSYCLAAVNHNIFAVNVCFDIMKEIMDKSINHNKNTFNPEAINENWVNSKDKNVSMSHDLLKNSNRGNNKNTVVPNKICNNITCIRLCCPFGNRLVNGKCIAGQGNFIFLRKMYGYVNDSLRNESKSVGNLFLLIVHDPCQKTEHYQIQDNFLNKNVFLVNGSLYLPNYNTIVESTSYCLAKGTVNVCLDIASKFIEHVDNPRNQDKSVSISTIISMCGFLGSLLFSLVMFIVYSIVPELRNIHGFILRGYSGSTVVVNTIEIIKIFITVDATEKFICIVYAFVKYYFYLARWFWLSIISIDIWHTFRKLRSLQRGANGMKQQERKKLILYSAYGWGGPFMLAIFFAIMEFIPGIPENFRPTFGNDECWLSGNAYFFYYLGVVIVCIIIIITLCISTAGKIAHYEKDIAHYLKDSESRRYKDNKQWFGLYLEAIKVLFIIICVKHFMYATQSFCEERSSSLTYMYVALAVIEQFCIFIIFVWKKKIRQLLLKQLGCQCQSLFSANQHVIASSNSNTSETTSL